MKHLLQSKGFKKNLLKWLFMYCGVMCILTIVVTYSRYLSSQSYKDTARVAAFDIKVEPISCNGMGITTPNNVTCIGKDTNIAQGIRPNKQVGFYFKVDTSKLEVETTLTISMRIQNKVRIDSEDNSRYFSNYRLYDVTEIANNETLDLSSSQNFPFNNIEGNKIKNASTDETTNITSLALTGKINSSNRGEQERIYMLVMDYSYDGNELEQNDLLTIDYSATQELK